MSTGARGEEVSAVAVMPKVSVVVATNRASAFLAEAIDSATSQSGVSVEVIVVDDGSPDPTALHAHTAGRDAITVIRQEAAGVAAARNAGVMSARGEYVAFLDDDDRWDSHRLAIQVADLDARPQAVVGYCELRTIDAEGRVLVEPDQFQVDGIDDVVERRTGIIAPNMLVRRADFRAVGGFDESLTVAEDLDLLLRLARRGEVVFSANARVDYRAHALNTTARYRALARGIQAVLRADRARPTPGGASAAAYRSSLRSNERYVWWCAARAARGHWRERRPVRAAGELAWAAGFAPAGPLWWAAARLRRGGRGVRP